MKYLVKYRGEKIIVGNRYRALEIAGELGIKRILMLKKKKKRY